MSPVKYELGFYIPEDDILHSHRRENLKSYTERLRLRAFSYSLLARWSFSPGSRGEPMGSKLWVRTSA
jgi:hypothetical protein